MNKTQFTSISAIILVYIQLIIAVWRAAILIRYGFGDFIFASFSMESILTWLIPSVACAYFVGNDDRTIRSTGILVLWGILGAVGLYFVLPEMENYSDKFAAAIGLFVIIPVMPITYQQLKIGIEQSRRILILVGVLLLALAFAIPVIIGWGNQSLLICTGAYGILSFLIYVTLMISDSTDKPQHKMIGMMLVMVFGLIWIGKIGSTVSRNGHITYNGQEYRIVFSDKDYYYCIDEDGSRMLLNPSGIVVRPE